MSTVMTRVKTALTPGGVAWSYFAYLVTPLAGLATGPILARALGVEGRGEMAAILAPLTVADAIAHLGIPMAVTYAVARNVSPREAVESGWRLGRLSALATFIGLALVATVYAPKTGLAYWQLVLFWGWPFISTFIAMRRGAVAGAGLFHRIDAERIMSGVLRLVLFAAVFAIGGTAVIPYIVCHMATFALASYFVMRLPAFDENEVRHEGIDTKYALSVAPGAIAQTLNNRLDQALIPLLLGAAALGIYTTSVSVAEIPLVLGTVLHRNMLTKAAKGVQLTQTYPIMFGTMALTFTAVPFAWWLGPDVLAWVFGQPFREAGEILWILCLGSVFGVGSQSLLGFIMGSGHPKTASIIIGAGALLTALVFTAMWAFDARSLTLVAWAAVVVHAVLFAYALVTARNARIQEKIFK